ncbi:MAG TPA: TVP38/TMEM64 family protein [Peptococcaceae bacterium]|nr:TVP38/TMEM64 family protein [Peptococcaceae bacterium]
MVQGNKLKLFFASVIGLIVLIMIYYGAQKVSAISLKELVTYTPESLFSAALLLWGMYCLKGITMVIPHKLLFMFAGIIFPPGVAIVVTYGGLYLEMTIGFLLGKRLGRNKIEALAAKYKRAQIILGFSRDNSILSSFLVRFIPILPTELSSMFMGAIKIKYFPYIIGTFLGITPGMLPVVMMGEALANPFSIEFLIPLVLSIAIAIISVFYYEKKIKKGVEQRDL